MRKPGVDEPARLVGGVGQRRLLQRTEVREALGRLGAVMDRGEEPDLSLLLDPAILLPLLGLSLLALLPVAWKRWKRARAR